MNQLVAFLHQENDTMRVRGSHTAARLAASLVGEAHGKAEKGEAEKDDKATRPPLASPTPNHPAPPQEEVEKALLRLRETFRGLHPTVQQHVLQSAVGSAIDLLPRYQDRSHGGVGVMTPWCGCV